MDGIKNVRIAIIGIGCRGYFCAQLLSKMDDVEIVAICDVKYERMEPLANELQEKTGKRPYMYKDYKDAISRDDIDIVYIYTSWQTHTMIAIYAMNMGKDVAMEIGGASSVEECWSLVEAQEKTGRFFMFLENCCYDRKELALLNMVKQGVFGEVVHCQCGYEHDLRDEVCNGGEFGTGHYRLDHYLSRNGEIYPTHGLGPVARILDINKGNRMTSLVSMSSKAVGCEKWVKDNLPHDHKLQNVKFTQGDVVNTIVKCYNGETILLTHDTTLPRPYSRALRVQGTKGIYMEDGNNIYIENVSKLHEWQSFDAYMEKYDHPIWKEYLAQGVKEGHGGIDYLVQRACIDAWKAKDDPPIDVYDAASWMVITALSEKSIAEGSVPVEIPDFTKGRWKTRKENEEKCMDKRDYMPVWECSVCGNINTGVYCPKCGRKNERAHNDFADVWVCNCGRKNNGNFCIICGESRNNVGKSIEWVCSCGRKNNSRFCIKCGEKRPDNVNNEEVPEIVCVSENAEPLEVVPADEIVNISEPAVVEEAEALNEETAEAENTCECEEITVEENIFEEPVYEEVIYMDENETTSCVSENAEPMEVVPADEITNISDPDCKICAVDEEEGQAPQFLSDEEDEGWVCTCGTKNTTRFCINCGFGKNEPSKKEYRYCKFCGGKIKKASKFCNQCGEKQ